MPRLEKPSSHCACCLRGAVRIASFAPGWCGDCRAHIIDGSHLKPHERTYEARFGVVCPFAPHAEPLPKPASIRCENCGCSIALEREPGSCPLCGHPVALEAIA